MREGQWHTTGQNKSDKTLQHYNEQQKDTTYGSGLNRQHASEEVNTKQ